MGRTKHAQYIVGSKNRNHESDLLNIQWLKKTTLHRVVFVIYYK